SVHDTVVSARAGFNAKELSALWPRRGEWELHEHDAGLFTHCFVARRTAPRAARRADSMDDATVTPVRLTGPAALRWGFRFARDPLMATRRCFDAFGPLVMLAEALPFIRPGRVAAFDVPLVLTAGAAFQRELLSDPETWRGVSLLPG